MSIDLPSIWHNVADVGGPLMKNTGSVVAAIAISKLVLEVWRNTFGRRRRWMNQYRQLSIGLQVDYAFELFGKAAYKRVLQYSPSTDDQDSPKKIAEYVWPLATDGYLQIIVDDDDTLIRYSLTTRSWRFRPRINMGPVHKGKVSFTVKLGQTTFASIPWEMYDKIVLTRGASFYKYSETRYYGRPGGYLDWICSHNMTGCGSLEAIPHSIPADDNAPHLTNEWLEGLTPEDRAVVDTCRERTVINTVTVSSMNDASVKDSLSYGPRGESIGLRPS